MGDFAEEIKSSLGFEKVISGLGQTGAQQVPLAAIFIHIGAGSLNTSDNPLHQCWRVDESQNPKGEIHGIDNLDLICRLGVDSCIPDTFTRDGQILGIGRGNDALVVGRKQAWGFITVKHNFSIGFIGNEIDSAFIGFAFGKEQTAQLAPIARRNKYDPWDYWAS